VSHPILERLGHPDPAVRRAACRDAAGDPAATLLADALVRALGDPERAVARAASDALASVARRDRAVLALVRRSLDDARIGRRFAAVETLARVEPPAAKWIPILVEALASPEGEVRWSAARLLVAAGRSQGEVLPLLLGLVRSDERPGVRRMAGFALRELAPELPAAAEALLAASRDRAVDVRRAAFTALAALVDPPPAVAARLADALGSDPDPIARRLAALALGELAVGDPGRLPAPALAALREAGRAPDDPELRRVAGESLERLRAGRRT
jgi:HEAT repeat protein